MQKLYLAHPLNCRREVRKLQLRLEGKYNIEFINPFYNNIYERREIAKLDKLKFKKDKIAYTESWDIQTCHHIVDVDLELIRKSDGILAFLSKPAIGTCQEIFVASYIYRIPVYVITKDCQTHPWIRSLVERSNGRIFRTITEYKQFLDQLVGERE
ncbi:MAG: hypothetical protein R6U65_02745 [Perlabentimonas sp.]